MPSLRYQLIIDAAGEVARRVEHAIAYGWEPYGGPVSLGEVGGVPQAAQALTRRDDAMYATPQHLLVLKELVSEFANAWDCGYSPEDPDHNYHDVLTRAAAVILENDQSYVPPWQVPGSWLYRLQHPEETK